MCRGRCSTRRPRTPASGRKSGSTIRSRSGDNLWVDRDGRAEIDYGGGQFRLAGDTNLHVSRLDDRQLALFIAPGRVIVRVRMLEPDDSVRVDTPTTQITLTRPGLYRIDVASDSPQTTVIVREGEAQVATDAGAVQVLPGQIGIVVGRAGRAAPTSATAAASTDSTRGARRATASTKRRGNTTYVSPADGRRTPISTRTERGRPIPTTAPSGSRRASRPTGRRIATAAGRGSSGWGYTWVDDAPWGYAPFHYGRWAFIGGRWGWCPGAFVARPVWAPALVAWYGGAGWPYPVSYGGPSTAGSRSAGASRSFRGGAACTARCWAATTGRTR